MFDHHAFHEDAKPGDLTSIPAHLLAKLGGGLTMAWARPSLPERKKTTTPNDGGGLS